MAKRPKLAMLACLLAALAGALALVPGRQAGQAIAAVIQDPMSLFSSRSPGERPAGALARI